PKQVAGYLNVSVRTVYTRWEKLGGLKIGRTLRFRKELIDALFRPEKEEVEGGGEARKRKIHAGLQDKDRGEVLGSGEVEGLGKPETDCRNRHGLLDGV
ncbi:MAG: helix-turn-helix domain-containing protein, partial [Syntrophales bacterium]